MGYLRKFGRRVGLVSTLLIGGVMGGLMAPLPSDAAGVVRPPELTLQVDGLPATTATGATLPGTSILGSSVACNTADVGLGYNACYAININPNTVYSGTNGRMYRIQNATGATARLRVGDNLGQDNFSLVGVQFIPVNSATQATTTVTNWGPPNTNTNEEHILTIRAKKKFNSAVNVNNATGLVVNGTTVGPTASGIRSGGEFRSAPLSTPVPTTSLFCGPQTTGTVGTVRCSTVGDRVVYTARGIFDDNIGAVDILSPPGPNNNNPVVPNSLPLNLTVGTGSASSSIVSFNGLTNPTVGQVNPTYPRFNCVDRAFPTTCQPEITLTWVATLKGPDTFVLVNGGEAYCAICNFKDNSKLTRLVTLITKVRNLLIVIERNHPNEVLRAIIARANVFLANFNTTKDPTCPEGAKYIETIMNYEGLLDQTAFTADGAVQADIEPPHYYAVISSPNLTWNQARDAAQALGAGWHLATITSEAEQAIINSLLPDPTSLTGTKQYWIGGQQNDAVEPGGNWQWINDEGTFWDNGSTGMFANWGNNVNGPGVGIQPDDLGGQHHLSLDNRYGWGWDDNDQFLSGIILGYVAEGPNPLPVND